jgi:formiminotetrahydrofolate cyclodeaminase
MEEVPIFEMRLREFIDLSASKSHVPGGGSVSAVAGTLGASMAAMVGNLTLDKSGYENVKESLEDLIRDITSGIGLLKELAKKDMSAFDEFMKVYRLPKGTEEERQKRDKALEEAAKKTLLAPWEIAEQCHWLLSLNLMMSKIGNRFAINDSGVAAFLLEGALKAALLSFDVNLALVKDKAYVFDKVMKRNDLISDSERIRRETVKIVEERRT